MENGELLKLKIMLCLLRSDAEGATVTGIARTLNKEKYAISRALTALEKENLISRTDGRKPLLTATGRTAAERYAQRMQIFLDHLLYEGVVPENARNDALYLACYCSDHTMERMRDMDDRLRIKYELRGRRQFSGAAICRLLRDGRYELPYIIYRDSIRAGTNLSIANEGFEHPCILHVRDGVGTIHLHAVSMSRKLPGEEMYVSAKVRNMKYFDKGLFVSAEIYGDLFSFPAEALNFVSYGSGAGQLLHGSLCLQIECPMDFGGQAQVIFTAIL